MSNKAIVIMSHVTIVIVSYVEKMMWHEEEGTKAKTFSSDEIKPKQGKSINKSSQNGKQNSG